VFVVRKQEIRSKTNIKI